MAINLPCKGCIVFGICTEICERLTKNDSIIMDYILNKRECIDCGDNRCKTYTSKLGDNYYLLCTGCNSVYSIMTIVYMPLRIERLYKNLDLAVWGWIRYDSECHTITEFLSKFIGDSYD
jgi:hypothetical protein